MDHAGRHQLRYALLAGAIALLGLYLRAARAVHRAGPGRAVVERREVAVPPQPLQVAPTQNPRLMAHLWLRWRQQDVNDWQVMECTRWLHCEKGEAIQEAIASAAIRRN